MQCKLLNTFHSMLNQSFVNMAPLFTTFQRKMLGKKRLEVMMLIKGKMQSLQTELV